MMTADGQTSGKRKQEPIPCSESNTIRPIDARRAYSSRRGIR